MNYHYFTMLRKCQNDKKLFRFFYNDENTISLYFPWLTRLASITYSFCIACYNLVKYPALRGGEAPCLVLSFFTTLNSRSLNCMNMSDLFIVMTCRKLCNSTTFLNSYSYTQSELSRRDKRLGINVYFQISFIYLYIWF